MNIKFQRILKKHELKHLIEVKRSPKSLSKLAGFVAGFSDSFILLHRLEWDTFRLNGYTLIREDDVSEYRLFDRETYWQFRAAISSKLIPKRPASVSIKSLSEFFSSVAKRYALVMIHPEKTKPDVCYLGSFVSATDRTVTIEDLDSNAEWTGPRRLKLGDITRIDFGGGYEEALARTAPTRSTSIRSVV